MKTYLLVALVFFFFTSINQSQSISWQQLSGPHGGAIYSIVHDNSGNIYVNTVWGAGPFKSTDDGENWFSIMNGLSPNDNGGFHPLNINSSGDLFIGGAHGSAYICRSTDGGNNWDPLDLNTNGGIIICIAIDGNDNIYVGTGTGIYWSFDNGDSWELYGSFTTGTEAIAFNASGHIFAGNSGGVYRSTDGGASWMQLPTGGGTRTVAVAPTGYVFAGCQENAGILRSTDNGDSWSYVYPQTVSIRFASTLFFDGNVIYFPTWGEGVLKSMDSGDTWTEFNDGIGYNYIRAITISPTGLLVAGGGYGIYKTDYTGTSWHSIGLPISSVRKIAINSNDNIFATVWGINRSTDEGQSWETINNGIDNYDIRAITVSNNGDIYIGAIPQNWSVNNLYRSTDNGENWAPVLSFPLNSLVAVTGLASGPNGEIVAVGSGMGSICHISTDDGVSWTDINYNLNFGPSEVAINPSGDIFIMGGSQGIWRKLAVDTVWTQVLTGNVGATLFIASNEHIYTTYSKSTDNGQTWTTIGNGSYINSFAENSAGHLFFGTNDFGQGVYRSVDFGETWELISDGLPTSININALAVDSEDYLYAGTGGKSMFKTTTSTVVSVEDLEFKPTSFSLNQNYPNPFNPTTNIRFRIAEFGYVTLKVYDVLGNEIAILINEEKPAGEYEVEFNLSAGRPGTSSINHIPSSGIYFYQLKAGSFIQTKKMVLMK